MCTALQIPEVTLEWMQTCHELVKSLVQQAPSQAVARRQLQQASEPDQQTLLRLCELLQQLECASSPLAWSTWTLWSCDCGSTCGRLGW